MELVDVEGAKKLFFHMLSVVDGQNVGNGGRRGVACLCGGVAEVSMVRIKDPSIEFLRFKKASTLYRDPRDQASLG